MGFNEATFSSVAYGLFFVSALAYIVHLVTRRSGQGRWGSWLGFGLADVSGGRELGFVAGQRRAAAVALPAERGTLNTSTVSGLIATWAALMGLLVQTLAVILRSFEAGHWPFVSTYEMAMMLVWGTVLIYLILEAIMRTRVAGAFILPIAWIIQTYALVVIPDAEKQAYPLVPALQSYWLQIHVATAIIAYAAFAAGAGASVMYLVKALRPKMGFVASLPGLDSIDEFNMRTISFGFPMQALVLITGAIWAEKAWGTYWSWDPKEVWALVTWLIYAAWLHARVVRGWRGRATAILSIVGFVTVLFTWVGVNWLARVVGLDSLHTY